MGQHYRYHRHRRFRVQQTRLLSVQCNTLHGTEYKITCGVRVCVCAHGILVSNISKTLRDRDLVPMDNK